MRTLIVCALLAAALAGQSFEAASVKRNRSVSMESEWSLRGGSFTARNVTLRIVIASAYGELDQPLADYQISGGPNWLSSDRFDIVAKASGDATLKMLRGLLEDRFRLKTHDVVKDMPIYIMSRARADGTLGPGLRPSAPGAAPGGRVLAGHLSATGLTISQVVSGLGRFMPDVSRVVVDKTGLTGSYDLDLTWTPDQAAQSAGATDANAPSFFTALREQLGLKLEPGRGQVRTLIIDHVEQPTDD